MKREEFLVALEQALEVPAGTLKPAASLDSLGCWDSMAALVFMSLADQKCGLAVSGGDVQKCKTVQDLTQLLGDKLHGLTWVMINPLDLSGTIVMVTGASAGIGKTTSQILSQLGARIILVSRKVEGLKETEKTLAGDGHIVAPFDFDNVEGIEAWFKEVVPRAGMLNGLVHCAGSQILRPLKLTTAPETELLLRRNVVSGLVLAKAFRQKGFHAPQASLVFVSSVMGSVGAAGRAAYCASKGALDAMVKSLALELVADDIRVNCVAPGFVATGMLESVAKTVGPEAYAALQKSHPLGFGQPEDVAHAIAFLLAKTSRWITGTALVVDGGYTAH